MKSFDLVQEAHGLASPNLGGPWFGLPVEAAAVHPDGVATSMRFRTQLRIDTLPDAPALLHLCADSRYRLSINGDLVAAGPAKPSGTTWFTDTIDIRSHLSPGINTIGIDVLSYTASALGNASVPRTGRPGLLVRGTIAGIDLSRPAAWKCHTVQGRHFHQGNNTVFLGIQETVNGQTSEHAWLDPEFDDSHWQTPVLDSQQPFSSVPRPTLAHRPIPHLTLDSAPITAISTTSNPNMDWGRLLRGESLQVPAGTDVSVDLDAGVLMTAFLSAAFEAGRGTRVEITAAECYEQTPTEVPWLRRKGDRTDHINGDLYGDPDSYTLSGTGTQERPERYSPYWFRTFRFIRLRITTAEAAVRIHPLTLTQTHYPVEISGSFKSSSDLDRTLWDVSVRTLLNCMHETFEDCPFYEQLQYAMDTRSQALFSLHLSADDRLIRRAIEDFAASGDPMGLTESRFPSVEPQFIPGFSLYWVRMVADHVDHVGDRSFTERFISRIDAVLRHFDDWVSADGFVISPEDDGNVWNFVDWTDAWRLTRGVPELGPRRANTIATFMYLAALRSAASITKFCGREGLSREYSSRADALTALILAGPAFDEETGYFRDTDRGRPQSVHAQVWAVLAGAVQGDQAADLLRRATADPELAQCSYAAALDLFDALRSAQAHDRISWKPWEDMLAMNLTTWAEDTVSLRSDCHAWGSVPLQHFPRYILGVRPASPGFTSATIDPAPSDLDWAEGTVPTPYGLISVHWKRATEGSRRVTVSAPLAIGLKLADSASQIAEHVDNHQRTLTFTL
ncbi:alpha-L-rhamnosidase C-terminal domain-containing protein [Pseudarthrobacter sp. WHRI 8279]|uniref:alpha-L-rhamnosidase-related protein n=1 Tax=Pseudarthrobacter sp. WHRI 8279 TaxID=3162566 RepID=UPI0032F08F4C